MAGRARRQLQTPFLLPSLRMFFFSLCAFVNIVPSLSLCVWFARLMLFLCQSKSSRGWIEQWQHAHAFNSNNENRRRKYQEKSSFRFIFFARKNWLREQIAWQGSGRAVVAEKILIINSLCRCRWAGVRAHSLYANAIFFSPRANDTFRILKNLHLIREHKRSWAEGCRRHDDGLRVALLFARRQNGKFKFEAQTKTEYSFFAFCYSLGQKFTNALPAASAANAARFSVPMKQQKATTQYGQRFHTEMRDPKKKAHLWSAWACHLIHGVISFVAKSLFIISSFACILHCRFEPMRSSRWLWRSCAHIECDFLMSGRHTWLRDARHAKIHLMWQHRRADREKRRRNWDREKKKTKNL